MPFSNAQQRDALDTAFRSMARMAIADSDATSEGASPWAHLDVSIDLRKCFENLRRMLLWHTGEQHNYPLVALRLSLVTYSFRRRILGPYDIVGREVIASRGIAAGSAHATSELKLYLLPVIIAFRQRTQHTPGIMRSLSVFVDDISFSVSHPDADVTVTDAIDTFRILRHELSAVDLPIAADKTEAIASADGLLASFTTHTLCVSMLATLAKSLGWTFATLLPGDGLPRKRFALPLGPKHALQHDDGSSLSGNSGIVTFGAGQPSASLLSVPCRTDLWYATA
jgi:hypothetical protein